jgi:hypothetical protein
MQVAMKTSATPECVAGVVWALRDLFHPQGCLCGCGTDMRLTAAQIRKKVPAKLRTPAHQGRRCERQDMGHDRTLIGHCDFVPLGRTLSPPIGGHVLSYDRLVAICPHLPVWLVPPSRPPPPSEKLRCGTRTARSYGPNSTEAPAGHCRCAARSQQ